MYQYDFYFYDISTYAASTVLGWKENQKIMIATLPETKFYS